MRCALSGAPFALHLEDRVDGRAIDRERSLICAGTEPSVGSAVQVTTLIVAERRDFLRGCLSHWLGLFCQEFQTLAVADVTTTLGEAPLEQAAAVLIGVGRAERADGWLVRQVAWLRERCPAVPIAVLMETPDTEDARAVETTARQLGVQGCITTSTSPNVAAAALRLVVAGGRYFPTSANLPQSSEAAGTGPVRAPMAGQPFEKLTPREQAVLSILAVGAQNKIIAYRLGMSMSTVKAHMHSIIRKLQVRNRTEAVVAARALELTHGTDLRGDLREAA